MSRQITIEVSDEVARQASHVAAQTKQRLEDVLAGWLQSLLSEMPVEPLPDDEVTALTELHLPPEQQDALSTLLERNRENTLDDDQRRRLDELMRVYERGLLRKAQALRVALQRGLREPLQA
jgi:hypothetical protein